MPLALNKKVITLNDLPGRTQRIEHSIRLVDDIPFRIKHYPAPIHATGAVHTEINKMLTSGIIRRSSSIYASPITVAMKNDITTRLCIGFMQLNRITLFDAEPISTSEEIVPTLNGARYFTKLMHLNKTSLANTAIRRLQSVHSISNVERTWNSITCHLAHLQPPARFKNPC
ncbi:hypothetical protein RRG08_051984 [Elysia crispata]|uniref:Uncharacterized protein n=1 Tax=Elysia crispata TaxID=231223 RepID=A0AAE0ZCU3_9GAST|nr:hypothetical protein RRG08_051984 [Elysia crispata]